MALRLIEAICTDEISDWVPRFIVEDVRRPIGPWHQIAQAILDGDQWQLERAMEDARRSYSRLGYRIVIRGYAFYVATEPEAVRVRLAMELS